MCTRSGVGGTTSTGEGARRGSILDSDPNIRSSPIRDSNTRSPPIRSPPIRDSNIRRVEIRDPETGEVIEKEAISVDSIDR